jgi:hypothetical protein
MWRRRWPFRILFRGRLRRVDYLDHQHTDGDTRLPLAKHPGLGE